MWLIVLPLILETEFVVGIWLGEYPEHTINFIRLTLILNTINIFQAILAMGIRATGKIMWYQLLFSSLEFILFVVIYVLLHHGFAPEWTFICGIITAGLKVITMWVLSHKQLHISIKDFVTDVLWKSLLVSVISAIVPIYLYFQLTEGWLRFLIVLVSSLACSSLCILYLGCSSSERDMLVSMVLAKIKGNNE